MSSVDAASAVPGGGRKPAKNYDFRPAGLVLAGLFLGVYFISPSSETLRGEDAMNVYSIALFLHVISAIGNFFGNGTLLLCMAALRRATRVEQVRTILALTAITIRIFPLSIVLLIATGLLMAVIAWSVQGWDGVALVSFVLIAVPLGGIVAGRRFGAIVKMAQEAPDGPLPVALEAHIHDPILGTALQTITALLLGIVFLMTTKPTRIVSILVMAIALVLGLASGLPLARARRDGGRQER